MTNARKIKKNKNKTRKNKLWKFAKALQNNIPRSELWFYNEFKPYWIATDERNIPFSGYIPDIINKTYKYIIEIDGSIHQREDIKRKDLKKDKKYQQHDFKVIRIEAYNLESFNNAIKKILEIRGQNYKPAKVFTREEINKMDISVLVQPISRR